MKFLKQILRKLGFKICDHEWGEDERMWEGAYGYLKVGRLTGVTHIFRTCQKCRKIKKIKL